MGIELYYSNQLDVLFECLNINLLASHRHFKDPFDADKIIVLNSHIRKWLQLKLAVKNGVVANVKFPFLEGVLWELLESLDKNPIHADFLNKEKLRVILYEFFLTKLPSELQILEKFINHSSSQKMKWARTWMLAEKIASLLMEYEYQRPDMIERWMKGNLYLPKEHQEVEIAQKFLYLTFLHPVTGLLQKREKPLLTLFQYSNNLFSKPIRKIEGAKPIHMFAISQVSVFHQSLLSKLKGYFDFHIYAFNPCCELWEDIKTTKEDYQFLKVNREKSLRLSDEEIEKMEVIAPAEDNVLLKNWGKTGREYIKLMSSLVDYNYYPGFIAEDIPLANETVLQRVKRHILYRKNGSDEEKIRQDRSIQIFNAPNITREVQTVYNNILQNLKDNSNLKLQEIVVLVPKLDDYYSSIVSVFEGSSVPLKFGITGNSAITDSLWAKGLLSVFDIAKGLMTRKDIFQYLANPCAMCKFNYSEGQIQKWANWVDKLNIYHHFSEKDKHEAGFPETLFFTWKQGLQRLRMGRLFASSNKFSNEGFPFFIPEDVSKDDLDDLEKFTLILESLGEVVLDFKKNKTPSEWVEAIVNISSRFLKVPVDLEEEIKIIPGLLRNLQNIKDFDTAAKELNSIAHLNLDMVYEVLVSALAVSDSVKSGFMNGGVVISELQPMRPFPFKITYILGLGGVTFPGRDVTFPLDLRIFKRKIGDISNSDRNRYLFLENFLSTSEKLYLSWVNKNLIKNDSLEPSSVILQLKRYLETEVIKVQDIKKGFVLQSVPLQSFQIPNYAKFNDVTTDLFHSFSLADHTHAQIISKSLSEEKLIKKVPEVKRFFATYKPSTTKENMLDLKYKIKANDIKKYLEFPSFAYMGYQLNIKENQYDEEDQLTKVLEPLNLNRLQGYAINKSIALNYFDQCKFQNKRLDFLTFVQSTIDNLKTRYAKESTLGEGAFLDYLLKKQEAENLKEIGFYETVAQEIMNATYFYPGIFFGVKMDEELKGCVNQSLILSSPVVSDEKFTADLSLDIRNCWQKDKAINIAINKKSAAIKDGFYKDILPIMMAFAFSQDNFFASAEQIKIFTLDSKVIKSKVDKNKFKDYFLELIRSFLFENNQLMLPGKLAVKMRELIKSDSSNDFNSFFSEALKSQIGVEYGVKVPDYLSLGNFEVSLNSKNLYLTRFAYFDFFEDESKNEDT